MKLPDNNKKYTVCLLEVILLVISTISVSSILLLWLGLFSSVRALILGTLLFCLIAGLLKLELVSKDSRFDIKIWVILVLAFVLRMHFNPYLVGDQDPGMYIIMGKQFETTGKAFVTDTVRDKLPKDALAAYDLYRYGDVALLPGVALVDPKAHVYQMPFYPLYPCWLAISTRLFTESNQQVILVVFSLLTLVAFYLLGYEVSNKNKNAGYLAAVLLALNPLHVFYSTKSATEIVALAFMSFGFYYLCRFYNDSREGRLNWIDLFMSCVLINNYFYTRISGFLYLPLFALIFLLTVFSDKLPIFKKYISTYLLVLLHLFFVSNVFYYAIYRAYLFETIYVSYLGRNWQRYGLAGIIFIVGILLVSKYIKGRPVISYLLGIIRTFISAHRRLIITILSIVGILLLGFWVLKTPGKILSTGLLVGAAVSLFIIDFVVYFKRSKSVKLDFRSINWPRMLGIFTILFFLFNFIKAVYTLGFTNSYTNVYYTDNLIVNFKNGTYSFSHTVLYNIMLFISPVGLAVLFASLIKLHRKITVPQALILLLTVYFWLLITLNAIFVGYPMYHARYYISEIVPYALLSISLFIINLPKRLRTTLIILIVIYFIPFTYFYAVYQETTGGNLYSSISNTISKDDLLLIDGGKSKDNSAYLVATVLKYYFNYNVMFLGNIQGLFDKNDLTEFSSFKSIYYLYTKDPPISDKPNVLCTDTKNLYFDISYVTNDNIHRYGYLPYKAEKKLFLKSDLLLPSIYSTREVPFKLCRLTETPESRFERAFKWRGLLDIAYLYINSRVSGLGSDNLITDDVEINNLNLLNGSKFKVLDIDAHPNNVTICDLNVWINGQRAGLLNRNKLTFDLGEVALIDTIRIGCSDGYSIDNYTILDSIRFRTRSNSIVTLPVVK